MPPLKSVSISPEPKWKRAWLICLTIVCVVLGERLLQWQNNFLDLDKNMTRITARYKEEAQFLLAGDFLIRDRRYRGASGRSLTLT